MMFAMRGPSKWRRFISTFSRFDETLLQQRFPRPLSLSAGMFRRRHPNQHHDLILDDHYLQYSSSTYIERRPTERSNSPPFSPEQQGNVLSASSMKDLWMGSTTRALDYNLIPVGSMSSLNWHLTENLVLHWCQQDKNSTIKTNKDSYNQQHNNRGRPNRALSNQIERMVEMNRLAFSLLDRLAQEKGFFSNATAAELGDDDFRTIDVSLLHAFLKQWKTCFQHQNIIQLKSESQREEISAILSPPELLEKFDDWTSSSFVQTNIATYSILMDGAISNHSYTEGPDFCKDLIDRLFHESSNGHSDVAPTMVTIGILLQALANTQTEVAATEAESWLEKIPQLLNVEPNTVIYTTIIRAWAGVGRADKAEALLRRMCQKYYERHEADGGSECDAAKPNLWTFNTVLAAWSRSKDPGAVQKAESLLKTMESLSRKDGERNRMLDVAPTIVSYNSLLSTIASRSLRQDALTRAESWMEEIFQKATKMNTPTKDGSIYHQNASVARNRKRNDVSLFPNLITFRALFNIIADSKQLSDSEKADRMRYWLTRERSLSQGLTKLRGSEDHGDLQNHPTLMNHIKAFEKGN